MANSITSVNRLVPGLLERVNNSAGNSSKPDTESKTNFTELLSNMLNSVNELQQDSAQLQQAFLNGDPVELHQVMVKAEEAGLAMDLLLEIRNRLVTAYSELIRMPI